MQTKLVYMDESGDDGFPGSSKQFTLSGLCISSVNWRTTLEHIKRFRKMLKESFNFPVAMEFHVKEFILEKEPYRSYAHKWLPQEKLAILQLYCKLICSLDIQMITVVFDKAKIQAPLSKGQMLEAVLKESIDELEKQCCLEKKWNYFLISDKGRLGAMRKVVKKIPNQYMIEEVFEKDSADSYFIQLCDFIACMTRLYYEHCVCVNPISSRYSRIFDAAVIQDIFNQLNAKNFSRLVVVPK